MKRHAMKAQLRAFLTSAGDTETWSASWLALPTGQQLAVPIVRKVGWSTELVWQLNLLKPSGNFT
jgi:hypothetical protein